MGLLSGDIVALLRYSVGNEHVKGEIWSNCGCTVHLALDHDGGNLNQAVRQDYEAFVDAKSQEALPTGTNMEPVLATSWMS